MSQRRHVVAFTIPGFGHINRMLPVIAGLCDMGISVDFFADEIGRSRIERTGARFVNIYDGRDKDVPDNSSRPVLIRNVSFAGYWGDELVREIATLRPSLVIHDTFAVIGRVVSFHLKIPRINMRAGHNLQPARVLSALEASKSLRISDECRTSVQALKERHGIPDASPFTYFLDDSADLNIYSEPPEFLPLDQRGPFEPLEFFGSYWSADSANPSDSQDPFGPAAASSLRVLVGVGTAAWIERAEHTLRLLETVADAMAGYPNLVGLISLGSRGLAPPGLVERLTRHNVRVEPFVDQVSALRNASVFITHNGLNSTHEAIVHGVPMISHPLFGDQPALSARCQELGLAVPLGPAAGELPSIADVHQALDKVQSNRAVLQARLAEARRWENAVMERRPAVLQRIVDLMN